MFSWLFFFLVSSQLIASNEEYVYQGVWGTVSKPTFQSTLQKVIDRFLPYNPVILEIALQTGENTEFLAKQFPLGQVICVSPNSPDFVPLASNQNFRVHLLRFDVGGLELKILRDFPSLLKTCSVISIKTDFSNARKGKRMFEKIKRYLEFQEFPLISHWYRKEAFGEAVFIRKEFYDFLFH